MYLSRNNNSHGWKNKCLTCNNVTKQIWWFLHVASVKNTRPVFNCLSCRKWISLMQELNSLTFLFSQCFVQSYHLTHNITVTFHILRGPCVQYDDFWSRSWRSVCAWVCCCDQSMRYWVQFIHRLMINKGLGRSTRSVSCLLSHLVDCLRAIEDNIESGG